jgi:hypothetical protein
MEKVYSIRPLSTCKGMTYIELLRTTYRHDYLEVLYSRINCVHNFGAILSMGAMRLFKLVVAVSRPYNR